MSHASHLHRFGIGEKRPVLELNLAALLPPNYYLCLGVLSGLSLDEKEMHKCANNKCIINSVEGWKENWMTMIPTPVEFAED